MAKAPRKLTAQEEARMRFEYYRTHPERNTLSGNAGGGSKSRSWSFRDLEGRTWRGTLTVEPVSGAAGEYTARLVVAKSS